MRDPTDQFDIPDHLTWQMNLAIENHNVSLDATGILGETLVPTVDESGKPVLQGMKAIRGKQEDCEFQRIFPVEEPSNSVGGVLLVRRSNIKMIDCALSSPCATTCTRLLLSWTTRLQSDPKATLSLHSVSTPRLTCMSQTVSKAPSTTSLRTANTANRPVTWGSFCVLILVWLVLLHSIHNLQQVAGSAALRYHA